MVHKKLTNRQVLMEQSYNYRYIWMISLVAAMGGLLFGYDWVVIGGAKPFYEAYFSIGGDEHAWESGWAMSSALVGCLLGSLLSGALTDRIGRKKALIFAALLFTISAIGTALANNFDLFIFARILGGIGIGLASNVSPIYISEMSPAHMRGRFVSINQLTIVIGVLAAQVINLFIYNTHPIAPEATQALIRNSWNGQLGWRWMFAIETIPALLFLGLAFIIPESPRWLVKNYSADSARKTKARQILSKIGGNDYAEKQLLSIQKNLATHAQTFTYHQLLKPRVLKILGLGIGLAVFQQWCGINVIFNYAQEIFYAAGYDVSGTMFNIVITGMVNLLFTLIAIKTVDRWGRRPLMLFGSAGLMVTYTILGSCYYLGITGSAVLIVLLAAIAFYAMTLAPITWVLLSEIFPNHIRGFAMGICVSALWIASLLLTLTFKPINTALGAAGSFWLYGAICLIGFIFIKKHVPETKDKSLEEIEQSLGSNS
ncbi:sugar porter family MFS transporter [Paraglaciecola aquimarina]|uniref:Sugar porter family MFS transporter n=1 Tax=Paraglaciecola aquimarina TaxID=1235557 RepID=A0ABU3SRX5_9ALTE|nr:sugar porter family MFS transporter [Paraglaciecola aquimarina]MDU0352768.1 sugar porter family MFS transporter [Paraglaciecola aquimarina]